MTNARAADARTALPPHHPLLVLRGVRKTFGPQVALDDVDFELRAGEVHVLAGENGAGKSTLIRIIGGVHQPDRGRIHVNGEPVRFATPRRAATAGVAVIHQELSLIPDMSVADNLFLGRETSIAGWLRHEEQRTAARRSLAQLGLDIDVRRPVREFSIAVRQMIEIAKALLLDARIVVMDEPTSALREPEVRRLFECIAGLKARGCGIVYITHKLEEVYQIADRITVLRDGRWIVTGTPEHIPAPALVHHMVGRETTPGEPAPSAAPLQTLDETEPAVARDDAPALRLNRLTLHTRSERRAFHEISLSVRAGEIVGLAGLEGAGASELLHALFGDYRGRLSGTIQLAGERCAPRRPRDSMRRGLALVPSDRQRCGLVMPMSVADNFALPVLPKLSPGGWLLRRRQSDLVQRRAAELDLRARSTRLPVATLSGGNQQKVVLGKWMAASPRVLLLDEPTRGVDVGARQEIYRMLRRWAASGMAILLITSELPELLALADRIVVLHRGRIAAELDRGAATAENVIRAAMGA